MKPKLTLFVLIATALLLVSCKPTTESTPPAATQGNPPETDTSVPTIPPTEAPSQAPTTIPPARIATLQLTSAPTAAGVDHAGLVYSTMEGLWLVAHDGQSLFLIDQPEAVLSPDGKQLIFPFGELEDLWLADLLTGEQRNLTNTNDRYELTPLWWPARPEVIAFESKAMDEERFGSGNPTIIRLDGGGYQVLDNLKGAPMALSPDGMTIAFGCCDGPGVLYRLSEGPTTFNPSEYGIPATKLFEPEWSPDGGQLAWELGGPLAGEGSWQMGIAVFDLGSKTVKNLHTFTPLGGAEFPHYLAWSPDGAWLAFVTYAEVAELGRKPALWVARTDGSEEYFLGSGFNPTWSPDGAWLAFNQEGENPREPQIWLIPAGQWDEPTLIPILGELEGWIER